MGRGPNLTAAFEEHVRRRWKAGEPVSRIALVLGVYGPTTLQWVLERHGGIAPGLRLL